MKKDKDGHLVFDDVDHALNYMEKEMTEEKMFKEVTGRKRPPIGYDDPYARRLALLNASQKIKHPTRRKVLGFLIDATSPKSACCHMPIQLMSLFTKFKFKCFQCGKPCYTVKGINKQQAVNYLAYTLLKIKPKQVLEIERAAFEDVKDKLALNITPDKIGNILNEQYGVQK